MRLKLKQQKQKKKLLKAFNENIVGNKAELISVEALTVYVRLLKLLNTRQ